MESRFDVNLVEDPVTNEIFFDPVRTSCCGQPIEKDTVIKLCGDPCPLCRGGLKPANQLEKMGNQFVDEVIGNLLVAQPELYEAVHFNLDHFAQVVTNNRFSTKIGQRYIHVLENARNHLNNKAMKCDQEGKSAIQVLANTASGRNILRENKKIQQLISDENKMLTVNGITIIEWLAIDKEADEIKPEEKVAVPSQVTHSGLFARPRHLTREQEENVWKLTVCANERDVQQMINVNPYLLQQRATVVDFSGRQIANATLFQVALRVGDVEMCKMIKSIALDKLPEHGQENLNSQYNEVFPRGYKKHIIEQKNNTFDFAWIMSAIDNATHADLQAALRKRDNGSQLCRALDEYRIGFGEKSFHEKVFNPHHLLKAFEIYKAKFDSWGPHASEKRDLFWRQVVGYTQRYLPANYAQAFAQGLYYIVEDGEPLHRSLRYRHDEGSFDINSFSSPSGLGFDYALCGAGLRAQSMTGPAMASRLESFYKYTLSKNTAVALLEQKEDLDHSHGCLIM